MDTDLKNMIRELTRDGRFAQQRRLYQHGTTTVLRHCVNVAAVSLLLAGALRLSVNKRALLRGALLHDYFLYDWHTPGAAQGLHGLTHPKAALKNAQEDFDLTATEEDIILHHMFPLTPCPPASQEGWLVCLADKYCALKETFHPFLPRRLRKAERKGPV